MAKRKWARHKDTRKEAIAANDDGPTAEIRARARYIDGHGLMISVPIWIDWPSEQRRSIDQIAQAYRMIVGGLMPKAMKFGKEPLTIELPWLSETQEIIALRYFAWRQEMARYRMIDHVTWIVHCCHDLNSPIRNLEKFHSGIIFHTNISRCIY